MVTNFTEKFVITGVEYRVLLLEYLSTGNNVLQHSGVEWTTCMYLQRTIVPGTCGLLCVIVLDMAQVFHSRICVSVY